MLKRQQSSACQLRETSEIQPKLAIYIFLRVNNIAEFEQPEFDREFTLLERRVVRRQRAGKDEVSVIAVLIPLAEVLGEGGIERKAGSAVGIQDF